MRGLLLLMLAGFVAFGADDDWSKVKGLKTGAELHVFKTGAKQPISAQIVELRDESLIVIVKKTEMAIPKDEIDRIDARGNGTKGTKETTTKDAIDPDGSHTSSESAGYSFGSKGSFETVYRRPPATPKK